MAPIQVDQSQSVASSLNSTYTTTYSDTPGSDTNTCCVTEDFRLNNDATGSHSSSCAMNVGSPGKAEGLRDSSSNLVGNGQMFSRIDHTHHDSLPQQVHRAGQNERLRVDGKINSNMVENKGFTEGGVNDGVRTDLLDDVGGVAVDEMDDAVADENSSSSSNDVSSFLARLDAEADAVQEAGDLDLETKDNPAIDRGYAWIICMAVFLIQFLLVGYLKSGGVLFVEFQKRFQSSSSMTSLVIGLEEAVCSIGAFICIAIVLKRVTPRSISLIGCLLCVAGVVGCSLFDRLEYLIITHSLCFGLSVAFMYGTSIVVLNQYFVRRRALAVSIGTSGTSVGGIVLPPLIRYLFSTYQYTGGILMTGGVMMHVFIAVALLIPVDNHRKGISRAIKASPVPEVRVDGVAKIETNSWLRAGLHRLNAVCLCFQSSVSEEVVNNPQPRRQHHQGNHSNNSATGTVPTIQTNQTFDQSKFHSTSKGGLNFETFNSKLEICEEGVPLKIDTPAYFDETGLSPVVSSFTKDNDTSNGNLSVGIETSSPFGSHSSNILGSNSSIHLQYPDYLSRYRNRGSSLRSGIDTDSNVDTEGLHPFHRHNSILSSSRQTLSASIMFHSNLTLHTVADMVTTDLELRSYFKADNRSSEGSAFQRFRESCCDNPLLRSVSFWCLTAFFFCGCIGHAVPQIYIPALAKERGLSDADGAFFLSVLNVLDIISHMVPGIMITMGVAKATRICVVPMFIVGVISQLTFLYNSYEAILTMCILFGLFGGFYFAMQSVIIIETLGLGHFGPCIGFYLLVMGCGAAVSFPIAGALKDVTGSYSTSYHYLAAMEFVATAILVFLPLARKYDLKRGVLKPEA